MRHDGCRTPPARSPTPDGLSAAVTAQPEWSWWRRWWLTGTVARLHAAHGRAEQARAALAVQRQVRDWRDTRLAKGADAGGVPGSRGAASRACGGGAVGGRERRTPRAGSLVPQRAGAVPQRLRTPLTSRC